MNILSGSGGTTLYDVNSVVDPSELEKKKASLGE
jgi:hypothetical protein